MRKLRIFAGLLDHNDRKIRTWIKTLTATLAQSRKSQVCSNYSMMITIEDDRIKAAHDFNATTHSSNLTHQLLTPHSKYNLVLFSPWMSKPIGKTI